MSAKNNNKKRGITRRDFIKWSAAAGAAAKAVDWTKVGPSLAAPTVANTYRNICPYCSVSCGVKVDVDNATHANGTIVDIYGDETNVLNQGSLCSKGSALYQLVNSPARVTEPRVKIGDGVDGTWYRHSGGAEAGWLDIFGLTTWADNTYTSNTLNLANWETIGASGIPDGTPGSGTYKTLPQSMADTRATDPNKAGFWGSSHLTNEECYLYRKLLTLYGTHNIEHQARI